MNSETLDRLSFSKVCLVLFTSIQILIGLDFGFVRTASKKYRIILKTMCFACSVNMLTILIRQSYYVNFGFYLDISYVVEYIFDLIVIFNLKYSLYDFLLDFAHIDAVLKVNQTDMFDITNKALIYVFVSITLKVILTTGLCLSSVANSLCSKSVLDFLMNFFATFTLDFPIMILFLIMYTFYRRVGILKSKLSSKLITVSVSLKIYKDILDTVDKIKPMFDKVLIIIVCLNLPRAMLNMYTFLHDLKHKKEWVAFILEYVFVAQIAFLISLPAITAELVNGQTDEMNLMLQSRLIDTIDKANRSKIKDMLRYLAARPSQYYVWRKIPVDLRLPAILFSICTTYLIVIIQFTHLFD